MRKTFLAIMLTLFCIEMAQGQLTPAQKNTLDGIVEKTLEDMDPEEAERFKNSLEIQRQSFEEGQQLAQRIVDDRKKLIWTIVIIAVVGIGGAIIARRLRIRRSLTG